VDRILLLAGRISLAIRRFRDGSADSELRTTFVVVTEGIMRFVHVTDLPMGRNPEEVIRVLDALQMPSLFSQSGAADVGTAVARRWHRPRRLFWR
jgi:alkyl hydroperoxide reductase subunit AhpC